MFVNRFVDILTLFFYNYFLILGPLMCVGGVFYFFFLKELFSFQTFRAFLEGLKKFWVWYRRLSFFFTVSRLLYSGIVFPFIAPYLDGMGGESVLLVTSLWGFFSSTGVGVGKSGFSSAIQVMPGPDAFLKSYLRAHYFAPNLTGALPFGAKLLSNWLAIDNFKRYGASTVSAAIFFMEVEELEKSFLKVPSFPIPDPCAGKDDYERRNVGDYFIYSLVSKYFCNSHPISWSPTFAQVVFNYSHMINFVPAVFFEEGKGAQGVGISAFLQKSSTHDLICKSAPIEEGLLAVARARK